MIWVLVTGSGTDFAKDLWPWSDEVGSEVRPVWRDETTEKPERLSSSSDESGESETAEVRERKERAGSERERACRGMDDSGMASREEEERATRLGEG